MMVAKEKDLIRTNQAQARLPEGGRKGAKRVNHGDGIRMRVTVAPGSDVRWLVCCRCRSQYRSGAITSMADRGGDAVYKMETPVRWAVRAPPDRYHFQLATGRSAAAVAVICFVHNRCG